MMMNSTCLLFLLLAASLLAAEAFVVAPRTATPMTAPHRAPARTGALAALEVDAATAALDSFYQTQPYFSAFLTCCVKAGAADFVAQSTEEEEAVPAPPPTNTPWGFLQAALTNAQQQQQQQPDDKNSVDLSRSLAFICYGGLYQGLWQQFLYTELFPSWLSFLPPDLPPLAQIAFQVAIDMTLIGPFLCLPAAYAVKSLFTTADRVASLDVALDTVQTGIDKYRQDCTERGWLRKYWSLWIPVQFLVFGCIPMHLRVVFIAAVSFFWVFILSATAAETTTATEEPATAAKQPQASTAGATA